MSQPFPTTHRSLLQALAVLLLWLSTCAAAVHAQGVELRLLSVQRQDGELTLDFEAPITLPRSVEDALKHGVPVYFVAQAALYRSRWYWRDDRVARVTRTWRVAYQPLTSNWRVGFGGFNQNFASLDEALSVVSRSARWKIVDLSQLDSDSSYYLEFSYRLDSSQLPSPMQIGVGAQAAWVLGVERTLKIE